MLWWHTQYDMRQKLLLPSTVSVMSYSDGLTLSFFPLQSPCPLPMLNHRASFSPDPFRTRSSSKCNGLRGPFQTSSLHCTQSGPPDLSPHTETLGTGACVCCLWSPVNHSALGTHQESVITKNTTNSLKSTELKSILQTFPRSIGFNEQRKHILR